MASSDNRLYEFKPFCLDAASGTLLKDDVIVHLTPKAFETLLVLVQHALQVVEKDQLLKEVWPDSFVEEGSLSRNIYELRKALGDDSSEPRYIATIPKRGYRFIAPVTVVIRGDQEMKVSGVETDTTVIEKHTFARVISNEIEGSDQPYERLLTSPNDREEHLKLSGVSDRTLQFKRWTLAGAALFLVGIIGLVISYLVSVKTFVQREQE